MKYLLEGGYLLITYLEINKKSSKTTRLGLDILGKKSFNPNTSKKNEIYRAFRALVELDYVCVDVNPVTDEYYCSNCACFRVTLNESDVLACPKCGSQVIIIQKYTKLLTNDTSTGTEYQRPVHFSNWIEKIQGKENLTIPEDVINIVKKEIKRERKEDCMELLTESDIRRYLKKNRSRKQKYDTYYNHCTKILRLVTGIPPLQMTAQMELNLQNMFMAIQKPFKMYKNDRQNFLSFTYILYKLCQLLGYNEFLPKFRLPKNEEIIYKYDSIWKKICEYMGGEKTGVGDISWKFIKTYLY